MDSIEFKFGNKLTGVKEVGVSLVGSFVSCKNF